MNINLYTDQIDSGPIKDNTTQAEYTFKKSTHEDLVKENTDKNLDDYSQIYTNQNDIQSINKSYDKNTNFES